MSAINDAPTGLSIQKAGSDTYLLIVRVSNHRTDDIIIDFRNINIPNKQKTKIIEWAKAQLR